MDSSEIIFFSTFAILLVVSGSIKYLCNFETRKKLFYWQLYLQGTLLLIAFANINILFLIFTVPGWLIILLYNHKWARYCDHCEIILNRPSNKSLYLYGSQNKCPNCGRELKKLNMISPTEGNGRVG